MSSNHFVMKFIADKEIPYIKEAFSTIGTVESVAGSDINNRIIQSADGLIIRTITKINSQTLQNSHIRFVGTATSGTDHIDQIYLKQNNIHFTSAHGCNATAVAEFVINALFRYADKKNVSLQSLVLGIIGVGKAGTALKSKAESLGISCLLNDPPVKEKTKSKKYLSLQDLITQSDILSLHVPYTTDGKHPTLHLIDESVFEKMKPNTVIINTSRGGVIKEEALLKFQHKFQGLILDVWENEPNINLDVLEIADIATPHIAGYSIQGKIRATEMVYQTACRLLKKKQTWDVGKVKENTQKHIICLNPSHSSIIDVLTQSYDIYRDDQSMRKLFSHPDPRICFRNLRNNYIFRHEFSMCRIKNQSSLPMASRSLLSKMGFPMTDT